MLDALQPFSTFISPVKSLNRTKPSKNPYHSWFRILWRKKMKKHLSHHVCGLHLKQMLHHSVEN